MRYFTPCSRLILFIVFSFCPAVSSALTTDDMLRLKKADIPEDVIVEMVESGYQDADKVLKLKETGFADHSIKAIVRGETKNNLGKERISFETAGSARIMWYLVQRGKSVLQNSRKVDDAKICIIDNAGLRIEWKEKKDTGLLASFKPGGFPSPFYWVLNKGDMLLPGNYGSFRLQSSIDHKGKPDSDGHHYWELILEPRDVQLIENIKSVLASLK